jgi:curved DNA-binding protein CbpA
MARTRLDRDYYAILGLHPEATEEEIRRAYRRLALEWHPDQRPRDPGAAERFKEISEAYAVLINAPRRREYDQARQAGAAGSFRHTQEDLFRDLFTDPRASAIFEELAHEFERAGMRVDRHYFQQTLFGGRAVVVGGAVIVSPLTLVWPLVRMARATLRGTRRAASMGGAEHRPLPGRADVLATLTRLGRSLLGLPGRTASSAPASAPEDVILPLRLTRGEAEHGGQRRVRLPGVRGPEEVLVTIAPGVRSGTHLRLLGKGRQRPDGSRGDAYLAVEIAEWS